MRGGHGHVLVARRHVKRCHTLVNRSALSHDILCNVLYCGTSVGVSDVGGLELCSICSLCVHVVLYHLNSKKLKSMGVSNQGKIEEFKVENFR